MSASFYGLITVSTFFILGLSMPSCPGQQALQQQVDSLQTKSGEQAAKVQGLDAKATVLIKDMTDVKTLLTQVSNTVLEQRKEIEDLRESIKKLQESLNSRNTHSAKSSAPNPKKIKKH